jgi:hypothetical protein
MTLNKLTVEEKQSLLGPAVIGCLLGAFAAYAVFAFASEYAVQEATSPTFWATAGEASLAFAVCVAGTVGFLGLAPLAIGRLRSRSSDA